MKNIYLNCISHTVRTVPNLWQHPHSNSNPEKESRKQTVFQHAQTIPIHTHLQSTHAQTATVYAQSTPLYAQFAFVHITVPFVHEQFATLQEQIIKNIQGKNGK